MRMEESIEMIKNLPLERIIVATSKITFLYQLTSLKIRLGVIYLKLMQHTNTLQLTQ